MSSTADDSQNLGRSQKVGGKELPKLIYKIFQDEIDNMDSIEQSDVEL